VDIAWSIEAVADFNGDGSADILWRNLTTKQVAIWQMNGTAIDKADYLFNEGKEWQITGTGDFDGDGKADILWRNTDTGENAVWLINGTKFASGYYLQTVTDQNWKVTDIGDFNGDGLADILWNHQAAQQNALWQLDGATFIAADYLTATPVGWSVAAIGDFDGDGKTDLFWRHSSGETAVWLMQGSTIKQAAFLSTTLSPDWQTEIATAGDVDKDGQTDLVVTSRYIGQSPNQYANPARRSVGIWKMDGTQIRLSRSKGAQQYFSQDVDDPNWKIAG
jgi:FG-GAP-like repeat